MIHPNDIATEAILYLKNGKRKYGVLIENAEVNNSSYRFISNEKILNTGNYENCMEFFSTESIEAIDVNLK